jgi:MFS family permease
MENIKRQTMIKVWRRIVPLMALVFFFSYLDRINIGFAALQMNQDLGFSNAVFGTGAGFFAIGYALFGIPSTLLLHRLGARRWISLIMIAWGLCSAATALVKTPEQLYGVRLLLGMAEAGFSPGVILYFSYWFPSEYRGLALGSFFSIGPLGLIIGGPVSGILLSMDGQFGLSGWQWLFVVEALPTLLLVLAVFYFLTDKPADAHWLSAMEKEWLGERLLQEQRRIETAQNGSSVWRTLANGRVWMLAAFYLGIGTSGIGAILFLPLMIQSMGFSILNTGLVSVLPGLAAALALPLWGFWTDHSRNREVVVATACCAIAAGLLGTAALLPSPWAIVPLSVAMVGFYGCVAPFWTLPSAFLTGAAAAAGIAFINIMGNLGQFSGPYLLGRTSDLTGSYSVGLASLAAVAAAAAIIMTTQAVWKKTS